MVEKNLQQSTEFFTPKLGFDVHPYILVNNKQGIHHIGRYQWACLALKGKSPKVVIDIACGSGYGSFMLATALPDSHIIGVDYDARGVTQASQCYTQKNLEYQVGDITTWQGAQGSLPRCDAIVSFDTIEHLLHRDITLMRIADSLNDDGWLLLSTPCGHPLTRLNPAWEHHKCEYSDKDLHDYLWRFFARIVQPQDADFPAYDFWSGIMNRDEIRYLNRMNPVICQNPKRPPLYERRV